MKKKIYVTPEIVATDLLPNAPMLIGTSVPHNDNEETEEIFVREKNDMWNDDWTSR